MHNIERTPENPCIDIGHICRDPINVRKDTFRFTQRRTIPGANAWLRPDVPGPGTVRQIHELLPATGIDTRAGDTD